MRRRTVFALVLVAAFGYLRLWDGAGLAALLLLTWCCWVAWTAIRDEDKGVVSTTSNALLLGGILVLLLAVGLWLGGGLTAAAPYPLDIALMLACAVGVLLLLGRTKVTGEHRSVLVMALPLALLQLGASLATTPEATPLVSRQPTATPWASIMPPPAATPEVTPTATPKPASKPAKKAKPKRDKAKPAKKAKKVKKAKKAKRPNSGRNRSRSPQRTPPRTTGPSRSTAPPRTSPPPARTAPPPAAPAPQVTRKAAPKAPAPQRESKPKRPPKEDFSVTVPTG